MRNGHADHPNAAHQRQFKGGLPIVIVKLFEHFSRRAASIDQQTVDLTPGDNGFIDPGLNIRWAAQIAGDGQSLDAIIVGQRLGGSRHIISRTAAKRYFGAVGGQRLGDAVSQSFAGSGDQRGFVLQS